jgi:pimeloyl-ACP methyl ester carboxylesterase
MKKQYAFFPLWLLLLFSCGVNSFKDDLFTPGSGSMEYICEAPFAGDTVTLYYYIPEGDYASMSVQIVIPGMGRNGGEYRDAWKEKADQYGFAVLTPACKEEDFPELVYQQGNVKNANGTFNARSDMMFPLVDAWFRFFVDHSPLQAKRYNLYGHSAGGQFVHRFAIYCDSQLADKLVAANAGWYTFPADTIDYPYGLGESLSLLRLDKIAYYAKDLTLLLGTADTLRSSSLRKTPEADAQGLTRLARGETFYRWCRLDAEAMGVPFNWKIVYAEGIGHDNGRIGPVAADILYGTGQ